MPSLKIQKTSEEIEIDGVLKEAVWAKCAIATDFVQSFPSDTSFALTKTEVKVTYDDEYLYIAAICYDELEGDYVIQSLKRDFSYPISDAFAVFIDPFNDKTNGFSFAVNPLGVQREGLLQNGGGFGVTTIWDNKWFSAVKIEDKKWVVEMKIPFKTLRFKEGIETWGINFSRNDLKRNENSAWSPVPRNFNIANLAFSGEMKWDTPPKKTSTNISIIPYAIGTVAEDRENNAPTTVTGNAGFDAKIAVTSSLNLDLTVNPDYSQVEVDRQVTNLSRFSLFFPEKRQFFIENSDLFERFGFRQIRPFFSRRIGIKNGQQVPIIAGARLSGKVNKNWRIGLMNMQTKEVKELNEVGQNYTVAAVQRQVFERSNISAIFVNRQGMDGSSFSSTNYNRVAGLDFNLASSDSKWQGKAFAHKSFTNNIVEDDFTHGTWLNYNTEKWNIMWNHEYVGQNYIADVGFVPRVSHYNPDLDSIERRSYWRFEPAIYYKFYPKSDKINNHGPGIYWSEYLNGTYETTDRIAQLNYQVKFESSATSSLKFNHNRITLLYDTDVTFSGNTPIPKGVYEFSNARFDYSSNRRKKLNFSFFTDYGGYFNGQKLTLNTDVSYRVQPWAIFSLSFQENEIIMPEGYESTSLFLLGPKLEFSFTKSLFFTTFFQYNTQAKNVNINSRFQWRFKPMSDLFIVYTDNYVSTDFTPKNKTLVIKFIYWLNI